MKIEKISDNQIRCTLNKNDLAERHLKISELAYGSAKAKELFEDLLQKAAYEFGFETRDVPLMIEAIPVSADCIVLILTKVDDPEELDTRFSNFSSFGPYDELEDIQDDYDEDSDYDEMFAEPFSDKESFSGSEISNSNLSAADELPEEDISSIKNCNEAFGLFSPDTPLEELKKLEPKNPREEFLINNRIKELSEISDNTANQIIDLLNKINNYLTDSHGNTANNPSGIKSNNNPSFSIRCFSFDDFDTFIKGAISVSSLYTDHSSLYKSIDDNRYYLLLTKDKCSNTDFNKVCNILSEYGRKEHFNQSVAAYFVEHCKCIIKANAIEVALKLSGNLTL